MPRLADDAVVIGDGGDFVSFAGKFVEPKRPGGWLDPGPYGCLGAGLGSAIAARLARPSAQVVLLLGDGAAGFSLMDVDTLVRHHLPVVMVLRQQLRVGPGEGPDADALRLRRGRRPGPADAATTRSSRPSAAAGETVTDPRQIGPALDRAFAADVPYLVNVITDVDGRLPARDLRDLTVELRLARPEELDAVGEMTLAAYEEFFTGAEDDYRPACATRPRRAREAELWVAVEEGGLLGTRHPLPARLAVARARRWGRRGRVPDAGRRIPDARGRGAGRRWPRSARSAPAAAGATRMVLSSLADA